MQFGMNIQKFTTINHLKLLYFAYWTMVSRNHIMLFIQTGQRLKRISKIDVNASPAKSHGITTYSFFFFLQQYQPIGSIRVVILS